MRSPVLVDTCPPVFFAEDSHLSTHACEPSALSSLSTIPRPFLSPVLHESKKIGAVGGKRDRPARPRRDPDLTWPASSPARSDGAGSLTGGSRHACQDMLRPLGCVLLALPLRRASTRERDRYAGTFRVRIIFFIRTCLVSSAPLFLFWNILVSPVILWRYLRRFLS